MILDNSTLQTLVSGPPCVPTLYPVHCGIYLSVLCADLLCGEVQEIQSPRQGLPVVDDHLPNCHCPGWLPVLHPLAISSSSIYNVWGSPPPVYTQILDVGNREADLYLTPNPYRFYLFESHLVSSSSPFLTQFKAPTDQLIRMTPLA
ncbi:hypothetical protein DSO57_1019936 [Entomophthora muscae]|uniref:Uncharacterized protein n=1 Tax=Entomophthora muscae TaxID=34485 RepID=A0ACC2S607_9FUNG|nr:hypothetical protein DSO57_1019936 [Entomophthora muscae]